MNDEQGILRRLDHYADCIEKGVHVTGTQLKSLVKDIRGSGLVSSQSPPAEAQPADGLRVVTLSDAWDYANGRLSWNDLDARAVRHEGAAPPSAPVGMEGLAVGVREREGGPLVKLAYDRDEASEWVASAASDYRNQNLRAPNYSYVELVDRAALAQQPAPAAPVGVEVASLPALWRQREDNGEEHTEFDKGYEQASDECAEALERALAAQQPAAVDGAMVWKPINVLPASDDLFWFARGDTVDGPRPPQYGGYDAEEWDWFAPAEAPPFSAEMDALAAQQGGPQE